MFGFRPAPVVFDPFSAYMGRPAARHHDQGWWGGGGGLPAEFFGFQDAPAALGPAGARGRRAARQPCGCAACAAQAQQEQENDEFDAGLWERPQYYSPNATKPRRHPTVASQPAPADAYAQGGRRARQQQAPHPAAQHPFARAAAAAAAAAGAACSTESSDAESDASDPDFAPAPAPLQQQQQQRHGRCWFGRPAGARASAAARSSGSSGRDSSDNEPVGNMRQQQQQQQRQQQRGRPAAGGKGRHIPVQAGAASAAEQVPLGQQPKPRPEPQPPTPPVQRPARPARTLSRAEAATQIQSWWRMTRLWRQHTALKALEAAAGQLAAAAAKFDAYGRCSAAAAAPAKHHLTHAQYLELNELAMRVLLQLDSISCGVPELRAVRKRLTASAINLLDQVQAAYSAAVNASVELSDDVAASKRK